MLDPIYFYHLGAVCEGGPAARLHSRAATPVFVVVGPIASMAHSVQKTLSHGSGETNPISVSPRPGQLWRSHGSQQPSAWMESPWPLPLTPCAPRLHHGLQWRRPWRRPPPSHTRASAPLRVATAMAASMASPPLPPARTSRAKAASALSRARGRVALPLPTRRSSQPPPC